MYAIRVRAEQAVIEVVVSGRVDPEEGLRAASQAFALAQAGHITRAFCDLSAVGRDAASITVLGAGLAARLQPQQRVAVLCTGAQLAFCRRLAHRSGFAGNLGIFTREADARAWLTAPAGRGRLAGPARRHFLADGAATEPARKTRAAS